MAKYDWKQLEKEFILSNYKSVSSFLKSKDIKNNGTTRKYTSGWKEKKRQKEDEKKTKTIEKIIEKESENEAQQIVNIKSIANDLALKVIESSKELNMHLARNKKKTKTVEYDYKTNKPSKETINETEEIKSYIDIVDRQGLKMLASALKDLNEILVDKNQDNEIKLNNAKEILVKIKEVAKNDKDN